MTENKKSEWEIDGKAYGEALARSEERERAEGAQFPGGKPFPVVHQEADLAPDEPTEKADYYTVNDRPVKLVHLADGGLDVQALNMKTGEFERDMGYLTRCITGDGDVETFTAGEFKGYVAEVRARIAARKNA